MKSGDWKKDGKLREQTRVFGPILMSLIVMLKNRLVEMPCHLPIVPNRDGPELVRLPQDSSYLWSAVCPVHSHHFHVTVRYFSHLQSLVVRGCPKFCIITHKSYCRFKINLLLITHNFVVI